MAAAERMRARCACVLILALASPSVSFRAAPGTLTGAPIRGGSLRRRPLVRVQAVDAAAMHSPRSRQVGVAMGLFGRGNGVESQADDDEWYKVSEGVTAEMAEDCSVEEAAGIAGIVTMLMEACASDKKRLPRAAAEVLQALLSHPAGSQAFWTTYLTEPDLDKAAQAPYEQALVRCVERFPELNIGVISSCLAMSATEEALFVEEGDDFMQESARVSKERALDLIQYMSVQPNAKGQEHGLNWMLDLIDYEALDMACSTVELRQQDQQRVKQASNLYSEEA